MAYFKVLIEIWCDWDPRKNGRIGRTCSLREGAICTLPEVIRVVDRPQESENDAAMSFLGEKRAMPTRVRGRLSGAISGRKRAERWHARLVVF
jgi:hypothetical protein